MYVSTGFTPAARTRTSTCPGPGAGSGTSSSRSTAGPPNLWTRIAVVASSSPAQGLALPELPRPPERPGDRGLRSARFLRLEVAHARALGDGLRLEPRVRLEVDTAEHRDRERRADDDRAVAAHERHGA